MNETVLDHTAERWKEVDAMDEWDQRRKKIIKFPLNVKHYQNRYTENIEILSFERTKDTLTYVHTLSLWFSRIECNKGEVKEEWDGRRIKNYHLFLCAESSFLLLSLSSELNAK